MRVSVPYVDGIPMVPGVCLLCGASAVTFLRIAANMRLDLPRSLPGMAAASLTGVGYAQYRYYAIPTPVCRAHQRYHNRREWALLALGLGGFVLCAGLLLAVFALAMRFLPGAWPLVPALVPFGFGILYLRRRILRFRADGGFGVSYDAARNVVVFDSACAAFLQAAQARDARARCEDASS